MKKVLTICLTLLSVLSCQQEPKDYVKLQGKVTQLPETVDSMSIFIPDGYKKKIAFNEDGTIQDTLKVTEGKYTFKIGDEYGSIFLTNQDEISFETDYKDFDNQLKFKGDNKSATISNTYIDYYRMTSSYFTAEALKLPKEKFDSVIAAYKNAYNDFKTERKEIDAAVWKDIDQDYANILKNTQEYYQQTNEIQQKFNGKPSPDFAMESIDGTTVKLSDFKGKYVYIDVWATWCGPCKREIPYLKKLEEEYNNKDIVFVSMSIDEPAHKDKWRKFVEKEDLKGIQIFAGKAWKADFVQEFEIKGIPRFILVDKKGVVVDANAPRPSEAALKTLLDSLDI